MRVFFRSTRLKELCESPKRLRMKYGKQGEDVILERLDDLAAAPNAESLRHIAGRFEELSGDRKGSMSLRAQGGYRIVFRPHPEPGPLKADGGLDLPRITEIVIEDIVDYH